MFTDALISEVIGVLIVKLISSSMRAFLDLLVRDVALYPRCAEGVSTSLVDDLPDRLPQVAVRDQGPWLSVLLGHARDAQPCAHTQRAGHAREHLGRYREMWGDTGEI